ncbi:methionine--tRNA ligase subunit beta [candidate division WWE3 bacterium]|nr:methionine--tRNA ligase subunit beta [candidate division WWE3 bacterium]
MKEQITIDDLSKLDIRIGTIIEAESIPESDKLLKLLIDIGTEKRQILAGIKKIIENPQDLIGKQIPLLVNLKPREMFGFMSEGMILAASNDEGKPVLITPQTNVPSGSLVK